MRKCFQRLIVTVGLPVLGGACRNRSAFKPIHLFQMHGGQGALAGRAFKGKLAAVKQNDASAQGKAQTGAALGDVYKRQVSGKQLWNQTGGLPVSL